MNIGYTLVVSFCFPSPPRHRAPVERNHPGKAQTLAQLMAWCQALEQQGADPAWRVICRCPGDSCSTHSGLLLHQKQSHRFSCSINISLVVWIESRLKCLTYCHLEHTGWKQGKMMARCGALCKKRQWQNSGRSCWVRNVIFLFVRVLENKCSLVIAMQGIDNFCVLFVLIPWTSTECSTIELPCPSPSSCAGNFRSVRAGILGCDNRKRDLLPLRETFPAGAGERGESKICFIRHWGARKWLNLGESWTIPLLLAGSGHAVLLPQKTKWMQEQNNPDVGSLGSGCLEFELDGSSWEGTLGTGGTDTTSVRKRKGPEQHPAAPYGQDMAVDVCAGGAVK